jgi:hypothetical protein
MERLNFENTLYCYKECFLKFGVEVGVEESIVHYTDNGSRISCLNFTLLHAKFKKATFIITEEREALLNENDSWITSDSE